MGDKFLFANSEKEDADACIFGMPFDSTTSFKPGTRLGPRAIRDASYNLEFYSMALERSIGDIKIFDAGDTRFYTNPQHVISEISERIRELSKSDKFIVGLGGEHTVSYGIVKALKEIYKDVAVIQFDAHADLRTKYGFEKFSHACVMNLIGNDIGFENIYQFGIRSSDEEEQKFAEKTNFFPLHKYDTPQILEILDELNIDKKVYLTIDIDVLDPAYAPGVGTPEPGGITSNDMFKILDSLKNFDIVGFDVVEVNPMIDVSGITAMTATKIIREGILSFVE
ncbi:MAG: agmatinase [Candidatus Altiarchaeum hamiconexum]|uniref:Agmatinase n=1 Tax=Candidatus Altarchaeum hamiconexum TaxID=1803513 RepID=A0A8J7Z1Q0_9ARCH|nr:agmatinase [Candidatus Altarchaeum hamiconexum]PIV27791.1 MAG: agmatinase [Candidatus Altarchaeum sp. CG03_land_8_20_14_0_80_32_618]PIX49072.1 MAG: agmatinase [Candidatus Altarchaeum sp. CG_4_8_14_3_um_filter_33_2054]PJC13672.1 MAG: agmatinase [Candidatus Altarchaeum sp. CG_4_9_14_0_8_um_filter_32_206]NCN68969.1 agmatinase [Candidatus Altarchaeum hamiconexum]